jgi:hypothetical protein
MKRITTYDKKKKRDVFCGYVDNDTYYRDVDYSKHYMRKYRGYGIQSDVLSTLLRDGVKRVEIREGKTKTYISTLQDWLLKGKKGNYYHGDQVFLDIKLMEVR